MIRRPTPTWRKVIGIIIVVLVLLGACTLIFNGGMWGG